LAVQTQKPHVVIIGAGFAGLRAARELAKAPVDITVIDKNNHHLFQPLLYQVATAGLSPADIASPIRSVLRDQKNTEVLMAEVEGLDLKNRVVHTKFKHVGFDYLVVATGATHSYFGHDEWAPYAPGLKAISDATAVREKILAAFEAAEMEADPQQRSFLLTFVIVGGGPTGVEMAGAIAELAHRALAWDFRTIDPRDTRIVLVEAGPRVLSAFPQKLSEKAAKELERQGVDVRLDSRVEKVTADGVLVNGKWILSPSVIWAAGVVASPVVKWLGCETDRVGRAKVSPDLSIPGHPEVFVVGDAASVEGKDGRPLPGVAPVAMQQGKYVAEVIEKRLENDLDVKPFEYWDKGNLATVGRKFAIADVGTFKLSGFLAWVVWLFVHIFYLIGFRNRLMVMFEWAWAYLTSQRGVRLITNSTLMKLPVAKALKEESNVPSS